MTRVIRPVVDTDVSRLCELQTAGWIIEYPHVVDPIRLLDRDGFDLAAREANMRRLIVAPQTVSFLAAVQGLRQNSCTLRSVTGQRTCGLPNTTCGHWLSTQNSGLLRTAAVA